MGKIPSFPFYPADWLKDPAIRSCTLAARGLWMDLLCLMWECPKRGVLLTGTTPWTSEDIARAEGIPPTVVRRLLDELLAAGVASLDENKAFYSRRIVREELERQQKCRAGPEPSSSSSSFSFSKQKQKPPPEVRPNPKPEKPTPPVVCIEIVSCCGCEHSGSGAWFKHHRCGGAQERDLQRQLRRMTKASSSR